MLTLASSNTIDPKAVALMRTTALSALYWFVRSKGFSFEQVHVKSIRTEAKEFSFNFLLMITLAERDFVAEINYWHTGILHWMYSFIYTPYSGDFVTVQIVPADCGGEADELPTGIHPHSGDTLTVANFDMSSGATLAFEIDLRPDFVAKVMQRFSAKPLLV
jgi:hypothetical protein